MQSAPNCTCRRIWWGEQPKAPVQPQGDLSPPRAPEPTPPPDTADAPVPAPPPEVAGDPVDVMVPVSVSFFLRGR
ncbi:hypothetical protein [Stenotrophomonas sepilia]